ncbi:LysR family transcriptional regulator [Paenibacillus sp. FSL H8-0537]|uniref:LysR family transcriptional regulator n=1 Tax=Paenibacillus sp. FSL H8-0537 TaxID=2921399 RepID=UPI003100FEBB
MDLKELTTFQTIVQEGNFSKAALKLHYAQSTVTSQVQRLEKELGIQLFNRGWDAELTAAGQLFAAEVDKLIGHWHYVAEQAKALQQEEIGTVSIGALESLAKQVLPASLRRFQELKPRVSCHFVIGNTDTLSRAVLQGSLDFAICGEPADSAAFRFEPLFEESIAFVATNDHPLASRKGIDFAELLAYPLLIGGATCLYYLRLSKQFSRYDNAPLLHTISQISAIPAFIQQTAAIGVVLASTQLAPNLVALDVQLKDASIPIGLLQLRNEAYASTSKHQLMRFIKEELSLA